MKENKDEELVTMVIRIPRYKKKMIENIAKNQGRYEADLIRSGIDKELNIDLYQDKMEELIKQILKPVEENEFFDFMEDLSENQKLINVSTSMNLGFYGSNEFYIVTYGEN